MNKINFFMDKNKQISKKNRIIFITDYKETNKNKSSTQVAINNILRGLIENDIELFVVAIIDSFTNKNDVDLELENLGVEHLLIDSQINSDGKGKYRQLLLSLKAFLLKGRNYKSVINSVGNNCNVIISSCPGLESGIIQVLLKKNNTNIKTIQIWTDPYSAIGLENTNRLPFRRIAHRWLENKILASADKIYYFTEVLCNIQKRLFPEHNLKMDFYNGCSTIDYFDCEHDVHHPINLVGYSGSFNHIRRNINPLCSSAFRCLDLEFLVRGGGGILEKHESKNLTISNTAKRLPRNEVIKIEKQFDINVCVCDKKGFMVPGKVFMQASVPNYILVILDGNYKSEIKSYLSKFNRFVFAENSPDEIANAIKSIQTLDSYPYSKDVLLQFSRKNAISNIVLFLRELE